jgi:hypothetical protein
VCDCACGNYDSRCQNDGCSNGECRDCRDAREAEETQRARVTAALETIQANAAGHPAGLDPRKG